MKLQSVFKELYDQGYLIFLDNTNYVTNNDPSIEPENFANREKFLEMYTDEVKLGWIFCYTLNLNEVLKDLSNDTCFRVEFGFNSDTEKKALEVGRVLVSALSKHKFIACWDERALKDHKISTVVTVEDLPEHIQDLVDEYEDENDLAN